MKKIFILLLSVMLLTSSAPTASFAKEVAQPATAIAVDGKAATSLVEPTDQTLQSALVAVKDKITIPKEYSKFSYYFNDYNYNSYANAYWTFTWTNPANSSSIIVSCDNDQHIISYNKYNYDSKNGAIAKYLKSELEATARNFIGKVAPETSGEVKLISTEYSSIYSGDYTYTYQRVYNGIAFPDNSVVVSVSSVTGEVTGISVNWLYNASIPSAVSKLTKEDAAAIIKKNLKMKLIYRSNNLYIYDKMPSSNSKEAYLVYEPSADYISVDANTGKVYDSKNSLVNNAYDNAGMKAGYGDKKEAATQDSSANTSVLTEDELKQIQDLKNLISKSEAIKLVSENKSLYKDANLTKATADLSKSEDENGKVTYNWNVNFSDPRDINAKDYYAGYAYATVDAQTGKILYYYSSMKSNYDSSTDKWKSVKIKYDKKQSRTILENFLKAQASSQFSNSVLATDNNDYVAYYKNDVPVYGGYSYNYSRVNNKIEYPENYLYGSVDGVTGKIYSFGTVWNDSVTFQPVDNIITADKALDAYLSKDGYGLQYEINQVTTLSQKTGESSVKNEVRLVYRPDINPSYISPYTGEQMNYDGTAYTKTAPYVYKDITNTPANKNILLLADMNIGFEGDEFLPDKNITVDEIQKLLNNIGYGNDTINLPAKDSITREQLAQLFVNWLGLEKLSKLNVYQTSFSDSTSIDSQYRGAVALASGLGIITGDSSNMYNPNRYVTRAEAINIIMNYIDVQQKGVLY